ncbi:hypothetical protein [Actinophytocola sediminis]
MPSFAAANPITCTRSNEKRRIHETAHQDGALMHEVTVINNLLGHYVLRFLDADSGRMTPMSPEDERTLATHLATLATDIHTRANRRDRDGDAPLLAAR